MLSVCLNTLKSSEASAIQHATTPCCARAASKADSSCSSEVISPVSLKRFLCSPRLSNLFELMSIAVTNAPAERKATTHALPKIHQKSDMLMGVTQR